MQATLTKSKVISKCNYITSNMHRGILQLTTTPMYTGGGRLQIKETGRLAGELSQLLILAVGYYRRKQRVYQARIPLHFH